MGKLWFSGSAVAVSGQSVVSFKPPVYLQRVSVVRWWQCYKYTAQTVCGLLLLVHQPAVEESEVIIYKALKWNWGLKPMKNVHCSCCLWLSCIFFDLWCFFHTFCCCWSTDQHLTASSTSCTVQWDFGKLHGRTSAITENTSLLALFVGTYLPSWTQTC